jgi:hypothetical protein
MQVIRQGSETYFWPSNGSISTSSFLLSRAGCKLAVNIDVLIYVAGHSSASEGKGSLSRF